MKLPQAHSVNVPHGGTQPAWARCQAVAAPSRRMTRNLMMAMVAVSSWWPWGFCQAEALRLCERNVPLSADQQDQVLRFGGIVKAELEKSGQGMALIARSGVDLSRFGFRYSHAGLSVKASQHAPWSVRQLYYACDEHRPRIYDQGMSGFLLAGDAPTIGYVSLVFLPAEVAAALERVAMDDRQALSLLGAAYSANAFPFSVRYQNCNQWLLELLAATWGGLLDADASAEGLRTRAQGWLEDKGYVPSVFDVGYRPLMWLGAFIPWLHSDDHPPDDIDRSLYRVSMPASIEAFVHATVPGASRIEFCRTGRHVVVRRGWGSIAEGCEPEADDTVISLE